MSRQSPLNAGARNDVIALARYCEFYAGAADKLMGETIPFQPGFTVYTLREPHGVTGHIVPWNYPMQIIGRSIGGGAGHRQRLRPETRRRGLPDRAGLRRSRPAGGSARGRAERGAGPGGRGGRGADCPSGHPAYLLHRVGRHGPQGAGGGGRKRGAGDAGTGREIPSAGFRGRRSRRRAAVFSSTRASRTPVRPARPRPASSCSARFTTPFARGWPRPIAA